MMESLAATIRVRLAATLRLVESDNLRALLDTEREAGRAYGTLADAVQTELAFRQAGFHLTADCTCGGRGICLTCALANLEGRS